MAINVQRSLTNVRVALLQQQASADVKPPCTLPNSAWPPNYDATLLWRAARAADFELRPELVPHAKRFYGRGEGGCIDFINHWCDTFDPRNVGTDKPTWMPFVLFAKQEEMVKFVFACLYDQQPGLIEKCRTMGATWVAVAISVWLWLFRPGTAIGWGSQKAPSVDELGNLSSIFGKARALIERLPKVFKPEAMTLNYCRLLNHTNGSTIIGEVGDTIGRGGRSTIYFKDEAAHYERAEIIEAALSENTRVAIDISSVHGIGNLFHRSREAGIDWYPGAKIPRGKTRVLVMDWRDHPEYDQVWYDEKKQFHIERGTPHIFAQEIDRNYAASITGTIIPHEWAEACIDAHKILGVEPSGKRCSGLDIGDSDDGDRNAQVVRWGFLLERVEEWVARDPGVTARKAIANCLQWKVSDLQYDCIAIGTNVKSEANRLKDENNWPKSLTLTPWDAGGKVLRPWDRVVPEDPESPKNKDHFHNLKAQGWSELRSKVHYTWSLVKLIKAGTPRSELKIDEDRLFCIDSRIPLVYKLLKELCQATESTSARLKMVVDKAPEGTRSPNIADAIVMCYWPIPDRSGFVMLGAGPSIFVGGERYERGKS